MPEFTAGSSRRKKRLRPNFGSGLFGQSIWRLNTMLTNARVLGRSLVILDRLLSTLLGRPCVLQDEESVPLPFTSNTDSELL